VTRQFQSLGLYATLCAYFAPFSIALYLSLPNEMMDVDSVLVFFAILDARSYLIKNKLNMSSSSLLIVVGGAGSDGGCASDDVIDDNEQR
jgi:hypothetical protein